MLVGLDDILIISHIYRLLLDINHFGIQFSFNRYTAFGQYTARASGHKAHD